MRMRRRTRYARGMPVKKMVWSVCVVCAALSIGVELLAPATASFKIYYEVTATTARAKFFYNPIRKGSVASDGSVYDAMTGKPLEFAVVSGAEAKKDPLMSKADDGTDYIKVTLARPVPENGQ